MGFEDRVSQAVIDHLQPFNSPDGIPELELAFSEQMARTFNSPDGIQENYER